MRPVLQRWRSTALGRRVSRQANTPRAIADKNAQAPDSRSDMRLPNGDYSALKACSFAHAAAEPRMCSTTPSWPPPGSLPGLSGSPQGDWGEGDWGEDEEGLSPLEEEAAQLEAELLTEIVSQSGHRWLMYTLTVPQGAKRGRLLEIHREWRAEIGRRLRLPPHSLTEYRVIEPHADGSPH